MLGDTEKGKTVMKKTNEVSELVGVSKRTLQYYDDEGLISAERSENNHRLYDEKTLETLWNILLYKEMNFELKEIKYLLSISEDQLHVYLRKRKVEIGKEFEELNLQMKFISLVEQQGMPPVPEIKQGKETFTEHVELLRQKLQRED